MTNGEWILLPGWVKRALLDWGPIDIDALIEVDYSIDDGTAEIKVSFAPVTETIEVEFVKVK